LIRILTLVPDLAELAAKCATQGCARAWIAATTASAATAPSTTSATTASSATTRAATRCKSITAATGSGGAHGESAIQCRSAESAEAHRVVGHHSRCRYTQILAGRTVERARSESASPAATTTAIRDRPLARRLIHTRLRQPAAGTAVHQ